MPKNTNIAPCLAFVGTGSEVGKSVLVTAMCRVLANRGIRLMPFKAQNMSNNSGVTPEGLEMGRAQIVQAEASGVAPHVDMNPVLLKPSGNSGAQVVLLGRAADGGKDRPRHESKNLLFREAAAALDRLRARCDAVIMEGAGSCAEVNLLDRDIVNLPMAAYANAPAVLVADIDKGGVFAQITGTLACLPKAYQDRIAGFVINRFRGDSALFADGIAWLEQKTQKPCFGVIPWFADIRIESEDAVILEQPGSPPPATIQEPAVAVVRLPHISNFTDFDPLHAASGISVYFMEHPRDLSQFRAVILPGTKNTRADLEWMKKTGWTDRIRAYHEKGGCVLGICGGYQMLGQEVRDPDGLEGPSGDSRGLGLLPVDTTLAAPKTTTRDRFEWNGITAAAYEIHMGQTLRTGGAPLLRVVTQNDRPCDFMEGCTSEDGRVMGTYMHGLFDDPRILEKWLSSIGVTGVGLPEVQGPEARNIQYDRLAAHFEAHADVSALLDLLGAVPRK